MKRPPLLPASLGFLAVLLGGWSCSDRDTTNMPGESIFEFWAPPTPAEAVAWAVDPYDADKRFRGLLLLANAPWGGEPPYVQMYEMAANDGDPGVQAMAIRALAMHGSPEHAALAIERLESSNRLVRWESARALQRFYSPAAVAPLLARLDPAKEEDAQVRAAVARALGQYAEPRVVQGLIRALNDRHLVVNEQARVSLRTLTGEDFVFDARAWLGWTRNRDNLFAGRTEYEYPVFHRDQTFFETLMFWFQPPNEVAGRPIGAPAPGEESRGG
ncbi:MAG: HEAT repeat domain-containing protein [Phycisphaerales bacterium]|nr:HEAT repeat domain-containing protein [Phycisphaerales bacterium]